MPSARELLEQADALMRRNRGATGTPHTLSPPAASTSGGGSHGTLPPAELVHDERPPGERLGSERPAGERPAGERPAGAFPEPPVPLAALLLSPDAHALPRDGPSRQAEGNEGPLAVPEREDAFRAPMPSSDDDVPVLTDALPSGDPAASTPARAADLDDVPLLTDAVEEIEAPSVLDLPDDATGPGPGEVSAPEPIASVDELEREVIHSRHDDDAAIRAAAERNGQLTSAGFGGVQVYDAPDIGEVEAPDVEEVEAPDIGELEAPGIGEVEAPDVAVSHSDTAFAALSPAEAPPPDATDAHAPTPASTAPTQPTSTAPASAGRDADDQQRWTEMAEEIRMQVLQRIDLFTDTGLREQLAQRLQPVVDRAAADLVATINQHVGVILRAYVSEAIEREIERWRREGR